VQTHQEQKDQKENKVKKKPKEQKDSSGVLPAFVDVAAVEQEEAIADGDATGCDPPEMADVPPNMDCMSGFCLHFFAWACMLSLRRNCCLHHVQLAGCFEGCFCLLASCFRVLAAHRGYFLRV
jgi:hypothetical protein